MFGEAFDASGFSIGRGPAAETVMGMEMAEGGKISFLLDPELLGEHRARVAPRLLGHGA